jgi:glucosyl-dolichyl phosphate glucuronosyltransferase
LTISVIVCTYNRCGSLMKTLTSIMSSEMPPAVSWEVVVVDNNSTDETRSVVRDLACQYKHPLRYVFEPRQGKSHALNTGVREAQGEILAFLDDDIVASSTWLANLTSSLHTGEWSGAGGRIFPAESFLPPPWLAVGGQHDLAYMVYGHFDYGDDPRQLDCAPFGANMAFRKDMFDKYGGFRIDIGPNDRGLPRFNEDTEFGRRLLAAGERLRYEPFAIVYHPVQKERMSQDFMLKQLFELGRSSMPEVAQRPPIFGMPRHYFSLPKGVLFAAWHWLWAAGPQERFFMKSRIWYFAGLAVEFFQARRNRHLQHEKTA